MIRKKVIEESESRGGSATSQSNMPCACVAAFLQVGLEGVLLSSCSAAGTWRVSDLAGLGRDDLFSGLRYARSCTKKRKGSVARKSVHGHRFQLPTRLPPPSPALPELVYLLCPFARQRGRAGTCRGGADLAELRRHQGVPLKATGRARPGRVVFGRPALSCHL